MDNGSVAFMLSRNNVVKARMRNEDNSSRLEITLNEEDVKWIISQLNSILKEINNGKVNT
jgi:hypothetical protein